MVRANVRDVVSHLNANISLKPRTVVIAGVRSAVIQELLITLRRPAVPDRSRTDPSARTLAVSSRIAPTTIRSDSAIVLRPPSRHRHPTRARGAERSNVCDGWPTACQAHRAIGAGQGRGLAHRDRHRLALRHRPRGRGPAAAIILAGCGAPRSTHNSTVPPAVLQAVADEFTVARRSAGRRPHRFLGRGGRSCSPTSCRGDQGRAASRLRITSPRRERDDGVSFHWWAWGRASGR